MNRRARHRRRMSVFLRETLAENPEARERIRKTLEEGAFGRKASPAIKELLFPELCLTVIDGGKKSE